MLLCLPKNKREEEGTKEEEKEIYNMILMIGHKRKKKIEILNYKKIYNY